MDEARRPCRESSESKMNFEEFYSRSHLNPYTLRERELRCRAGHIRSKTETTVFHGKMASQDPQFLSPVPNERLRSTRSHSLKVFSMQPSFVYQRSKRTFSLPCTSRPILPPSIQIEQSRFIDEDIIEEPNNKKPKDTDESISSFSAIMGLSCSLFLFAWSCLLSHFSRT
ncbi:uncharacterized protein LOC116295667 [Actinia tenebrosa]|uniref:Uncharacterized protein LOC116295667 n=1 Tax=Actinia tenebrosa TaxID=6105 RepID=A0A6P8I3F0_ACTTE|nr:uncharacterized protein LOC116295667 [Actinia tenebrosa]